MHGEISIAHHIYWSVRLECIDEDKTTTSMASSYDQPQAFRKSVLKNACSRFNTVWKVDSIILIRKAMPKHGSVIGRFNEMNKVSWLSLHEIYALVWQHARSREVDIFCLVQWVPSLSWIGSTHCSKTPPVQRITPFWLEPHTRHGWSNYYKQEGNAIKRFPLNMAII
jgi:hypothetical protein